MGISGLNLRQNCVFLSNLPSSFSLTEGEGNELFEAVTYADKKSLA